MWVVYDHPRDDPEHFVARRWVIGPGFGQATNESVSAETLIEIRRLLPPGLACLSRCEKDDPCIVEVWM